MNLEEPKCPKCGEEENLHYNDDWSKWNRPTIDILCNECGTVFDPKQEKPKEWDVKFSKSMTTAKTTPVRLSNSQLREL
jgi:uncharacterized Zn finger protein